MIPKQRDKRGLLTNVLIEEMRKDYYRNKYQSPPPPPVKAGKSEEAETSSGKDKSTEATDSKDSEGASSMENENYHKASTVDVKLPNVDGTPV